MYMCAGARAAWRAVPSMIDKRSGEVARKGGCDKIRSTRVHASPLEFAFNAGSEVVSRSLFPVAGIETSIRGDGHARRRHLAFPPIVANKGRKEDVGVPEIRVG